MIASRFLSELKDGRVPYAVSVYGEDGYWRRKVLDALLSSIDPFDVTSYENADVSEVVFSLNTVPFMSEKRAVVVKTDFKGDKKSASILNEYLKNPNPTSILVLEFKKEIDGIVQAVCDKESENVLSDEIKNVLNRFSRTASEKVISLLIDYCDRDMSKIYSECMKLSSLRDGEIMVADVENCVEPSVNYNNYDFVKYVLNGDYVSCYDFLARKPEKFTSALASLIQSFRGGFYAKTQNVNNIASALGLNYYGVKTAKEIAKRYSAGDLYYLLSLLYDLEFKFKSGLIKADSAIPVMVTESIERRKNEF